MLSCSHFYVEYNKSNNFTFCSDRQKPGLHSLEWRVYVIVQSLRQDKTVYPYSKGKKLRAPNF